MIKIFVVIARLLDYPSAELLTAQTTLMEVVREETRLPLALRSSLVSFIQRLGARGLLDAQEDYVSTFDRGRSLSLLLFEHVHGESRDRGQAMVDLLQQYRDAGLELNIKELPDYIPLYLEYLATRTEAEAAQGLGDIHPILALLSARLQERDSPYHLLFDALLAMIGIQPNMAELRDKVAIESRDDTPAALDKVWEEEMVRFVEDKGSSCRPTQAANQAYTLHFREN
ncbi:nitrate reductase molybdenum cofactor assembly chaperone [Thiofilum flexile]|uniref:nitrate reductase molybdenum cofactor assembly chaperone n=1 Tax=Thiofilum flexile TaxID=125627 RepID=UPI00037A4435|nr:nitrate reductase molybdenum cofactor assembly chaperone [Thiofilum flexile]